MRLSTTSKSAMLGFSAFVAGIAWAELHAHLAKRDDPPGWIMDREFYPPAAFLARIGFLVFVISVLFSVGRAIYRRISNRITSD